MDELTAKSYRLQIANANELDRLRKELVDSLRKKADANDSKYLKDLTSRLMSFSSRSQTLSEELQILESLSFEVMSHRQAQITEAYPRTFNWLFGQESSHGDATQQRRTSSIFEWLQMYNGVYWICGKAGSGKSTLMKYLAGHESTLAALRKWSADKKLVTAQFFCWNAGTEMQKSQQGLLQTLLYHVLEQCPSLGRKICPRPYRCAEFGEICWTRTNLIEAFERLREHGIEHTRFCFFIDGLDEYRGDHKEIINIVDSFANAEGIKVVISSRPWNVFENRYGDNKGLKLLLQDLTRSDIKLFVTEGLREDPTFRELETSDAGYNELLTEIVDKADGVFLWVYLVVRSLRRGINNCDTISELQARVQELPGDLESYFRLMLDSIEPVYHRQSARLLLMRVGTLNKLTVATASCFDEEDPHFALAAKFSPCNPLQPEEFERLERRMTVRINARCTDLVEILNVNTQYGNKEPRVEFLHRMVRDFLNTRDIYQMLVTREGGGFDANRYLCNSMLFQMKLYLRSPAAGKRYEYISLSEFMHGFLYHARHLDISRGSNGEALLQDFDCTTKIVVETVRRNYDRNVLVYDVFLINGWHPDWLLLSALHHNLYDYVATRVDSVRDLIKRARTPHGTSHRYPPLSVALCFSNVLKHRDRTLLDFDPRLVALLLDQGACPNESYDGRPIWFVFLISGTEDLETQEVTSNSVSIIMKMLIQRGAHHQPGYMQNDDNRKALVENLLHFCRREETQYLVNLIDRNQRQMEGAMQDVIARHRLTCGATIFNGSSDHATPCTCDYHPRGWSRCRVRTSEGDLEEYHLCQICYPHPRQS